MEGDLRIRRYRDADQAAVWDLHNTALEAVDAHGGNGLWDDDLHRIGPAYLDAGGEFLVGELGDRLVAMGALRRESADRAEVTRMRVHPDVWRRGFGRAILTRLEARAAELGCHTLFLHTTSGQTAARRLYEASGYTEVRRTTWKRFEVIQYDKRL